MEYWIDKINEHDVWEAKRRGELLYSDVEEFTRELEDEIANLKLELSRLQDTFDSALRELEEAMPLCSVCEEPLDDKDEARDKLCSMCVDEEGGL